MRLALAETSSHGGLLHYTVQLADALAERGHDVDLFVPAGNELADRSGPATRRAELVPHVRSSAAPPSGRLGYQLRRVGIAARLTRSWGHLLRRARSGGYDALITGADVTIPVGGVGMLALLHLRRRPPVVFICHNVRPYNRWGGDALFLEKASWLLRRIYRRVDLVIVHGERSRVEFEQVWPGPVPAIVPHGDERVFGKEPPPPSPEERILFFGDWRKVKGIPVLMAAFDIVAARRPEARLTIAGTPAPADFDPEQIRRWAAGHGDRVTLIDRYVPIGEVPAIFATARVVATPYFVGYQSGVIHLAQTMGRAVVTSDVGDLGEAVGDGVGGYVVPVDDPEKLAERLEEVLADPELAERLGRGANERVAERASWETAAEQMELALLERLPTRPAGGRS